MNLARPVCKALLETTSREEVFACIAAAGAGNDDRKMEVVLQETEEPATKKQRSHPESQQTEPDVSKKELELLKPTPAEHTQQLRTFFIRDSGSGVAAERSQDSHPPTCTRLCLSIMSRNEE